MIIIHKQLRQVSVVVKTFTINFNVLFLSIVNVET